VVNVSVEKRDASAKMRREKRARFRRGGTQHKRTARQMDGAWRLTHTHWSFIQPQLAGAPPQ
jgi:hypothetical protein